MIIKEIKLSDKIQLDSLIEEVESNLENRLFWLPINDAGRYVQRGTIVCRRK